MDEDFKLQMNFVASSYSDRQNKTKQIWSGFDSEKEALEKKVEEGFKKALKTIDLKELVIKSTKAEYDPERKDFSLKIVDWAIFKDGRELNDRGFRRGGCCAYQHLDGIIDYHNQHPQILEFKKKFAVYYLNVRDCECGSDHK